MNTIQVAQAMIVDAVAKETLLAADSLSLSANFDEFGIESVMSVNITRELEEHFGQLSKSLLFEFPTISDLAEHFNDEHHDTLRALISDKPAQPSVVAEQMVQVEVKEPEVTVAVTQPDNQDMIASAVELPSILLQQPQVTQAPQRIEKHVVSKTAQSSEIGEDIAIIGMAGRFPEADNVEQFWKNLVEAKDCITEVPERLWRWQDYWDENKGINGKSYLKWGGFLSDNRTFDPLFFGISKLEAHSMDPQERVFLETVHHTFEDAGYNRDKLKSYTVGLYVGIMWGQYQLYGAMDASAGASYASIANRASYFFDLKGPSIPLDTMCSGSMTSVHLACESIRSGETDMAIAGGVNLTTHPNKYFVLSKTGFASSHGRCKSFSADGDGYVPSEGVGAVLLKSLSRAIADGDRIQAVVKASAINHGGRVNGFTVPNAQSQQALVSTALEKSGIDPQTISYFEAHAPGTALGDPIEVRGLTSAFKAYTDQKQFCPIGSVKSNIGHLESAASFASIAKVVKQMEHKTLVPSIHLENENDNIDFANSPFYLQKTLTPWKSTVNEQNGQLKMQPRRAAINSFGAGGANAHLLLEEYIEPINVPLPTIEEQHLIVLSARNEQTLKTLMQDYQVHIYKLLQSSETQSIEQINDALYNAINEVSQIRKDLISGSDLMSNLISHGDVQALVMALVEHCNVLVESDELAQCLYLEQLSHLVLEKTNTQLIASKEQAQRYLMSMSHTLRTGREHLATRVSFVVNDLLDLSEKLTLTLADQDHEDIARGKVKNASRPLVNSEQDLALINKLMSQRNLNRLGVLWCEGVDINWQDFYQVQPKLIALPLYPFTKEICWAPSASLIAPEVQVESTPSLVKAANNIDYQASLQKGGLVINHTVVQTDSEFCLHSDVTKQSYLIATLYQALAPFSTTGALQIKNINAHIELVADSKISLLCQAQGQSFSIDVFTEEAEIPFAHATFNPQTIEPEQMSFDAGSVLSAKLNPSTTEHKATGIQGFSRTGDVVTGRFDQLSDLAAGSSAFAALIGAINEFNDEERALEIGFDQALLSFDALPHSGWVVAHQHDNGQFDGFILNEQGQVIVYAQRMGIKTIGLPVPIDHLLYQPTYKSLSRVENDQTKISNIDDNRVLVVYPHSSRIAVKELMSKNGIKQPYYLQYGANLTADVISENEWHIGIEDFEYVKNCLVHISQVEQLVFFGASFSQVGEHSRMAAKDEVTLLHNIIRHADANNWFKQSDMKLRLFSHQCEEVKIDGDKKNVELSVYAGGISGYMRSLAREYPSNTITLFDCDDLGQSELKHGLQQKDKELFYRQGQYWSRAVEPLDLPLSDQQTVFFDEGVYVLIGGAGVVGRQISAYLASTYHAKIIWINRSPIDIERQQYIDEINQLGGECRYYSAAVQDKDKLSSIVDELEQQYGRVNGVFHLAMEREICRIKELTPQLLQQRLSAKMEGTDVVADVFADRKPDFLFLFSSAEGYVGSAGWSTYTAACSYQAQTAHRLSAQGCPAYVVNWGFWEGVDESITEMLLNKGIRFLTINEGIAVIKRMLAQQYTQAIALNVKDNVLTQMGFTPRPEAQVVDTPVSSKAEEGKTVVAIKPTLAPQASSQPSARKSSVAVTQQSVVENLVTLFSEVLKIDESDIDPDEDMLNYGVDSLIVLNIQTELEERAGAVSVNLLLENQTVSDIAQVMIKDFAEEAANLVGADATSAVVSDEVSEGEVIPAQTKVVEQLVSSGQAPLSGLKLLRQMSLAEGKTFLKDYSSYFNNKTLRSDTVIELDSSADLSQQLLHGVVDTSEGEIEVFACGQGIPVVLMSAVALTAPTWLYLLDSPLRQKYQFFIIHPPGYGISEPVSQSNTKGIINAVLETMDGLGLTRQVHIVGSCLGCAASIYLSKEYPERVASLSLVGGFHDTSDLQVGDPSNMSGAEFEALAASATQSLKDDFQAVIDNFQPSETWRTEQIVGRRELLLNSQCVNFLVALRYLNEMLGMSLLPWLQDVSVATHCIYGDVDAIISPRHSKEISSGINGAQLTCIPGAAHFPYLTHEKMFTPILERFIDEQEHQYQTHQSGQKMVNA